MSNIHNLNDHRHMRLFELLRQEHAAESIVGHVKGFKVRKVSKEELEDIKRIAALSIVRAH